MQITLIICAVALTAALIAFLIMAMRAAHQATQTLLKLELTLEHTNQTLEIASDALEGLDERLERLDPAIDRLVGLGRLAGTLTDVVSSSTRGPVAIGAGLALAAIRGYRAFTAKKPRRPEEVDNHERR